MKGNRKEKKIIFTFLVQTYDMVDLDLLWTPAFSPQIVGVANELGL